MSANLCGWTGRILERDEHAVWRDADRRDLRVLTAWLRGVPCMASKVAWFGRKLVL